MHSLEANLTESTDHWLTSKQALVPRGRRRRRRLRCLCQRTVVDVRKKVGQNIDVIYSSSRYSFAWYH